jgi:AcrR family transcriptional regulator
MSSRDGREQASDYTGPTLLTVQRPLTPAQRERRHRIIRAAMQLASEGGYEAVMMKEVAARSAVALGTLYRYFGSKDHLLSEALLEWGKQLTDNLRERPPEGSSASDRTAEVFRRMASGFESEPQLGVAVTSAMTSGEPSANQSREQLARVMREWFEVAIGSARIEQREETERVLELVCFGAMLGLVNGSRTAQQVGNELQRAARLVVRES